MDKLDQEKLIKLFKEELIKSEAQHLKLLLECRRKMIKTVSMLGTLQVKTPTEYAIMGFVELLDAMITSKPKIQMDILKGINKFIELLPDPKYKDDIETRQTTQTIIERFIERVGKIK